NPANYSRRPVPPDAPGGPPAIAYRVPAGCAGMRLDQALARMLPEHSRTRLKGWIDAARVTVDGAPWDGKRRVAGGERVDVLPALPAMSVADAAQNIALAIAFEDAAIIVLDKPAGLVVHPGSGNPDGT